MDNNEIKKDIPVTFALVDCRIMDFKFTDYAKTNKTPVPKDKYEFEFQMTMDIKEVDKNINLLLKLKVFEKKSNIAKYELCELTSLNIFNIVNFEEVFIKKGDQFQIPGNFISFANSVCVNNTRGMLVVKLEGSIYSNAVVPLIDMNLFNPIVPIPQPA